MTRPSYWTSPRNDDGSERVESRYMRRKLEYLLRHCATHPDGCQGQDGLREARVVKVERVENDALWRRYESRREAVSSAPPERARPALHDRGRVGPQRAVRGGARQCAVPGAWRLVYVCVLSGAWCMVWDV